MPNVPAAQYLRMSTEEQQYSLANQAAAIQRYAESHNFVIVRTYVDSGRSGLVLEHRKGLRTLIQDVVSGNAKFQVILVYDVSRWGRFQDADEAAHYEFLCKHAGIPVHYCAEQFSNDGTLSNSILKALKRTMAAEYSRELGVKVFEGKKRLAHLGFRAGGQAGYGLRRMMVSADGRRNRKLEAGEYKGLVTDHIVLVPGPRNEVEAVREIFTRALRQRVAQIVRDLNERGVTFVDGRSWNETGLHNLLRNPKYCGCNAWGRTESKLRNPIRRLPPDQWVMVPGAFGPIIDQGLFNRVQKAQERIKGKMPEKKLLGKLKRLLAARGQLTEVLVSRTRGVPHASTYLRRFGSIRRAYELIEYPTSAEILLRAKHTALTAQVRNRVLEQIEKASSDQVRRCFPFGNRRAALEVDPGLTVSLLVCLQYKTLQGWVRWQLRPLRGEGGCITLVCLLNADGDRVQHYYLMPGIDRVGEYQVKSARDPWLKQGMRLRKLADFSAAVRSMDRSKQARPPASVGLSVGTGTSGTPPVN